MLAAIPAAALALASFTTCAHAALIPLTKYPDANPLAAKYPFDVTGRENNSLHFLPIQKHVAESLIPSGDRLLPSHPVPGLAADEWPLVFNPGYDEDLSEYSLTSTDFSHAQAGIGWVDKSLDGRTPFLASFDLLYSDNPVLTSLSRPVAGFTAVVAEFKPAGLPFGYDEASGRYRYEASKDGEVLFAMEYVKTKRDALPRSLYVDALTQGSYQYKGCLYHEQFFSYAHTDPYDVIANITLGAAWLPEGVAGEYKNVRGLRLAQLWVETIDQPCKGQSKTHGSL